VNEIRDVLERTAHSVEEVPSDETVEADLRRGRAAMARRRRGLAIRFSVAGLAATVAVVGAVIVAGNLDQARFIGPPRLGQPNGPTHHSPVHGAPVRLVAYHGDQPEGFTVSQVPDGWYLQGTNAYRLTVAPEGDTTSPDAFVGKLVVTLLSRSAPQKLPDGDPVTVGGEPGVVSPGPPADTLTYRDDAGHLVQVQAWTSALHWTNEQLISFAEGVQVTADAQQGVG
jgi:hypothetical protein